MEYAPLKMYTFTSLNLNYPKNKAIRIMEGLLYCQTPTKLTRKNQLAVFITNLLKRVVVKFITTTMEYTENSLL